MATAAAREHAIITQTDQPPTFASSSSSDTLAEYIRILMPSTELELPGGCFAQPMYTTVIMRGEDSPGRIFGVGICGVGMTYITFFTKIGG